MILSKVENNEKSKAKGTAIMDESVHEALSFNEEVEKEQRFVDVQVLSTVPVMFSYWAKPMDTLEVAVFLNDHIAEICAKYPKRFVGLGTLPMQAPELAIAELRRCKEIGLQGIQIGTHINDWNLDAPELFPIFEACQH